MRSRTHSFRSLFAAAAIAAVLAAPAAAQSIPAPIDSSVAGAPAAADSLRPAGVAAAAAPSLDGARAGVRAVAPSPTAMAPARAQGRLDQSEVLMIVGGVALVVGLVVGDDAGQILALGGAVVGLYGLYQYLKTH